MENPIEGTGEEARFTKSATAKYLENASQCPFCGVEGEIEGISQEQDMGEISAEVKCANCKKRWWEVYTLHSIVPVEE